MNTRRFFALPSPEGAPGPVRKEPGFTPRDHSAMTRRTARTSGFLRRHGLSLVMLGLFFVCFLFGQVVTGRGEFNDERRKHGLAPLSYGEYLLSAHFGEATAENWESEFLQMFVYVVATVFLFQKGSAESKDPDQEDRPKPSRAHAPDTPWPVRRGGWILKVYEHSLSIALATLFVIAFCWHVHSGHRLFNQERVWEGASPSPLGEYLRSSRFWFESFQNWQSEFLAIGAMVILTIWLREARSPESKKIETPHWENEE
jgi:hypothetical protein